MKNKEQVWTKKDLLTLEELSTDEILHVLDTAVSFKEVVTRQVKKVPALRGTTIANLFFDSPKGVFSLNYYGI